MTDSITVLVEAEEASIQLSIIQSRSTTGQNSRLAGLYKLLLRKSGMGQQNWIPTMNPTLNWFCRNIRPLKKGSADQCGTEAFYQDNVPKMAKTQQNGDKHAMYDIPKIFYPGTYKLHADLCDQKVAPMHYCCRICHHVDYTMDKMLNSVTIPKIIGQLYMSTDMKMIDAFVSKKDKNKA